MGIRDVSPATKVPAEIAPSWWQSTKVRTLVQVLFLIGMGALATLMKNITLPLGLPGHSAVLWLGALVAGRVLIRRDGAALLMAATMALWAIPVGLKGTFIYNLGLYGATGLALDIAARLPKINILKPLGAIFCGILAHMVKFGFITATALAGGGAKKFVLFGWVESGLLHLAFGAAAGLLGWGAYWAWRHSYSNHRTPPEEPAKEAKQRPAL